MCFQSPAGVLADIDRRDDKDAAAKGSGETPKGGDEKPIQINAEMFTQALDDLPDDLDDLDDD